MPKLSLVICVFSKVLFKEHAVYAIPPLPKARQSSRFCSQKPLKLIKLGSQLSFYTFFLHFLDVLQD